MMSKDNPVNEKEGQTTYFLAKIFGISADEFSSFMQPTIRTTHAPANKVARMAGVMSLKNQPEFFADAPWRLEPDQVFLPVTIYIRDANIHSDDFSPWRLDNLLVEQWMEPGSWSKLATITPPIMPGVNSRGDINQGFWVHSLKIPILEMPTWTPGNYVHLRVKFIGSPYPYQKTHSIERHIQTLRAAHPLPLGRASFPDGARKWFYGDTHYHSAYTNDVKEFGAPIPETRLAGQGIGLDWLVITDHSTDLDEIDPGYSGRSRWERLKRELSSPAISDDRFRFILGEEITLIGRNNGLVHMLAIGAMGAMIEGAFLPDEGGSIETNIFKEAIEFIIKNGQGYPDNLNQQLFGKVNRLEDVMGRLSDRTLTFAAHPYNIAQVPPARWDEQDLSHSRLTGHEFWNGRIRRNAKQTNNPFMRNSWTDPATLKSRDEARIKKLMQLACEKWEAHLMRGVDEWVLGASLPSRKPVFIGGSDAHGDFNYHTGMAWDYSKVDMVDDDALGRVRTAIFLPDHQSTLVPGVDEILAALKKGSCIVTDGPIIEFHLRQKGHVANMGETLFITGGSEPELLVNTYSTPEFGEVQNVEVITYPNAPRKKPPSHSIVKKGQDKELILNGMRGYCRVQAMSTGVDGEQYCCFTNPIWFLIEGEQIQKMKVFFSSQMIEQ
jgi:hypothetical protein